jgi:Tfp pilus assembly protein PilF
MRTNRQSTVAWLSVLFLTFPGLASAYRQGRLIGKVVDPDGNPIPGVRVTTTCAEIPEFMDVTTTSDKGVFKVDFERLNVVYLYAFDKAGFVTLKIEQKWTLEGTERHEFTMIPAPPQAPASEASAPVPAAASTSSSAVEAFNAGVRAFKAKDYATAEAKFEEAAEYDPNMHQVWTALTAIYMEQQRYPQAAEVADKAIALGATDESLLKSRWEAYRQLGDEAKAAKAREDLERLGRLSEEAKRVYNEGVAATRTGDDPAAFARFKEALELDPNFEPALVALATSALELDRAAEAFAAAETLLKTDPEHAEALKILYNAALKLGDEAKLVDALVGLAAVDPGTARDGLFVLADAAFRRDDVVEARERFDDVLAIDPSHARAHYFLGLILMREGAKQEAKRHLERFLALAPNDPDAATARDALAYLR